MTPKGALLFIVYGGASLYLLGMSYFEYLIVTNGHLFLYRDSFSWVDMILTAIFGFTMVFFVSKRIDRLWKAD